MRASPSRSMSISSCGSRASTKCSSPSRRGRSGASVPTCCRRSPSTELWKTDSSCVAWCCRMCSSIRTVRWPCMPRPGSTPRASWPRSSRRSERMRAAVRRLPVLNATCPLVTKVHNQGKRYVGQGRKLILIGHAGHPEVEGTMGQIPSPVILVQNEAEVDGLDLPADTPVAYVTQTTLSVDDTQGIIAALQRKFSDIVGPETRDICYATQNRQSAVRELSELVDLILVRSEERRV